MRHIWNGIAHCDKLQNEFFSLFKRVHLWRRTIFLIFLVFLLHLWLYFSVLNFVFFISPSTIRLKKIIFIPNPCESEKYYSQWETFSSLEKKKILRTKYHYWLLHACSWHTKKKNLKFTYLLFHTLSAMQGEQWG